MEVIKRTGLKEPFTKKKIFDSIFKANNGVDEQYRITKKFITSITDEIYMDCENSGKETFDIDQIEDIVEQKLMESLAFNVAKSYITYRYEKERIRNTKHLTEKLMATNVVNQNANVDEFSFGGRIGEAASYMMRQYAIDNMLSKMAKQNHINNEIYIHDLDHYVTGDHNCLTIPFDRLFAKGFNTRQVDIRPASSLNTALQLVAVIFQLQSLQQFGGVSASHIDWSLVPYFRKSFKKHFLDGLKYIDEKDEEFIQRYSDKLGQYLETNPCLKKIEAVEVIPITDDLYSAFPKSKKYAHEKTIKELEQSVEGMYHNLNSLQSRSGNQLPFTSINYGTCTLPEGRLIIEAFLNGSIVGVGVHHRTSIFPCGIFQVGKGINLNKEDPNHDLFLLALKSTSQRLYPNYVNMDWSGNEGYDKEDPRTYSSTMGCRTWSAYDINGLGFMKDGRGNICPVTIVMPTLAKQVVDAVESLKKKDLAKGNVWDPGVQETQNVERFIKLLSKKIYEAKEMLLERFDWICSQPAKSAQFMYENGIMFGYDPEEGIKSAIKHGSLAIGQIGLAETLELLIGKNHTTKEGMKIAKKIEQTFSDLCNKFKTEYKLNFGVYYTPAEGLCNTALRKFREKYGVIKNVSDKEFFTNSIHVPVWQKVTPFEKIDIESELTGFSRAGCITYIELDAGSINNIGALEILVKYAMDKDIPYFAINVPVDFCENCHYEGSFNGKCPECGSEKIQQLRRVTGYLSTTVSHFNDGKQDEVKYRVKHNGCSVDA